ncbi:MAG TPA: AarF/UbiB family protein [Chloroflexota bacterium]|jgi:ubiquinone biosynthesis protein
MRQYIFQSAVDLVALILGLVLVTIVGLIADGQMAMADIAARLRSDVPLLPSVAIFSIILTAVHWFVRPLLLIFFGGWLMRSFGLFALILDILLLFVAAFVAPLQFQTSALPWWGIPVAAVLYDLIDGGLGILVGLNRPRLDGERRHAAVWKRLERLPSMRRNWISEKLRLEEASTTLLTYGLEIGLASTPVGELRRWFTRFVYGKPNPIDELSTPALIRVMLEQLGPTYIKFGQMASSQSQTLPGDWVAELSKLQSDVPPVPYEEAREVIISELGRPPEELYATFEQDAFAAASTAQVHRATLQDGTPVAVKVQRPNIAAAVKADLGVLQDVSNVVENVSSYARDLDVSGILGEFSDGVIRELDYHNEAYHARRLADILDPLPLVRVPTVYPELSSTRVLTMEFINGVQVNRSGALDRPDTDRVSLTEAFMRALIKQIFIDGFFHGDPHPGNILLDLDTGALTYIDLGLVGRLDQNKRLDLIDLLFSFQQQDAASLASLALRVSNKTRPVNVNQFREDMTEMLNQYVRYASHPKFDSMISEFFALLQRYGLRLDRQFMLAIKAVVQSEAVVSALGGHLDLVPFAMSEIKSLAVTEITRDKVIDTLSQQLTQVGKEVLRRVPNLQDATVSWLDQYMAGKLVVHVDTQDLTEHIDGLGETFTKLAAGLIMTGMLIGSAIVTTQMWQAVGEQPLIADVAMGVFVVLLAVGGRIMWRLLHPRRRPFTG